MAQEPEPFGVPLDDEPDDDSEGAQEKAPEDSNRPGSSIRAKASQVAKDELRSRAKQALTKRAATAGAGKVAASAGAGLVAKAAGGPAGWILLIKDILSSRYATLALIVWVGGLALMALLALAIVQGPYNGVLGTSPQEKIAIGNATDMDDLKLIDCLNQPREGGEKPEEQPLPEDCIKLLEGTDGKPGKLQQMKDKVDESIELANEQLEDGEAKSKALEHLNNMKKELEAINPRAPYKDIKPHTVKYQEELTAYYASLPGVVLDVPAASQQSDFDCGMTSVEMVVNYYRKQQNQNPNYICPNTSLVSNLNSELQKIPGAPQYSDITISLDSSAYIKNIEGSLNRGHPVIWLNDFYSGGHFVVLTGYRKEGGTITTFLTNDPGSGSKNSDSIKGVRLTPENLRAHGRHKDEGTGYFYVR